MSLARVRLLVSGLAGAMLLAHLLWPELRVDAISLGLLAVVILPWLSPLVKSAELPGGWKVQFQDVETAAARITGAASGAIPPKPTPPASPGLGPPISAPEMDISSTGAAWPVQPRPPMAQAGERAPEWTAELLLPDDPSLALLALRFSIEQKLRALAGRANQPISRNTNDLIRSLEGSRLLTDEQLGGLAAVIQAADRAAHGAVVDPSVAGWARTRGLDILNALDRAGRS